MPPPKRVLFVDDSAEVCEMMKVMLDGLGCEAQTANTWEQALMLAGSGNFDLYILDLMFPAGSGLELCRKIRKVDPQTPLIFYSAHTAQVSPYMVDAAGAQAAISKTARFDELQESIARLIGGADGSQGLEMRD